MSRFIAALSLMVLLAVTGCSALPQNVRETTSVPITTPTLYITVCDTYSKDLVRVADGPTDGPQFSKNLNDCPDPDSTEYKALRSARDAAASELCSAIVRDGASARYGEQLQKYTALYPERRTTMNAARQPWIDQQLATDTLRQPDCQQFTTLMFTHPGVMAQ